MIRDALILSLVWLVAATNDAPAQERGRAPRSSVPAAGARAGGAGPPASGDRKAAGPDFKIVFWFSSDGLKHQAYDVRKGQYTKAVDDWVNQPRFDASGFALGGPLPVVREVSLKNQEGATDADKLKAAIEAEERRIFGVGDSSPQQSALRQYLSRPPRMSVEPQTYQRSYSGSLGRHPGAMRPMGPTPSDSFPTPVPFPRRPP